jgi:hypothetical protein
MLPVSLGLKVMQVLTVWNLSFNPGQEETNSLNIFKV